MATSFRFSQFLDDAFQHTDQAQHRQLLWLSGSQDWCYQQLLSVAGRFNQANSLLVANKNQISPLCKQTGETEFLQQCLPAKDCYKLLGTEKQFIVFDGYAGINPDSLAQISGTLVGGGVFVIITPDVDYWDNWRETELNNLWVQPYKVEDVSRHFLDWLKHCLITDDKAMDYSQAIQENSLQNQASGNTSDNTINKADYSPLDKQSKITPVNLLALEQQLAVVSDLAIYLQQSKRACGVLTAARGRGKSAALGMLVNQLDSQMNVYVTASDKNAVKQIEEFSDLPIQFSHISQLMNMDAVKKQSLLIVDEAASISVEVLLELISKFSYVVLSTTTEGYEGTGQGFKLRFLQCLSQRNISFEQYSLTLPMRWAQWDPLEAWLNKLLFLAHTDDDILLTSADHLNDCNEPAKYSELNNDPVSVEKVSSAQLIKQPPLLQSLFSLLSQAHYRTTPGDLRIILDSPNMHLWLAFAHIKGSTVLVGVCLVAIEGPIASFVEDEQGMDGQVLAQAMYRGLRRPRGNLLPQILIGQEGYLDAKTLKIARIVRIATRIDYRCQGIAERLIGCITQWSEKYQCDYLAANFSLESDLLAFWYKQNFDLARIGSQLDPITASFSATVMKALKTQSRVLTHLNETFESRLAFSKLRVFEGDLTDKSLAMIEQFALKNTQRNINTVENSSAISDSSWYKEQLNCFANYHRPLASVAYIFILYLERYPHCWLSLHLKAKQGALLSDYFFSNKSLDEIYRLYALTNYKALQKELRLIAKKLLKCI